MIARTWHGAVPLENKEAFLEYEYETGVKDTLAVEGNRGAYLKVVEQGPTLISSCVRCGRIWSR